MNCGTVGPLLLHWVTNYFGVQMIGRIFVHDDSGTWLGILTVFYILWADWLVRRYGRSLRIGIAVSTRTS